MSQTAQTIKKIASSEEYKALEAAIKQNDPATIISSYIRVSATLAAAEKEILEKIQQLTRPNKHLDEQKFRSAFNARSQILLPQWHWVDSELKKQKVMEGQVFGIGSKGDPLARTPEGRVVAIRGATLKEGDKVRFKVVAEGEKIDFGRVFELTPETFYSILTQDTREQIMESLNSLRDCIDNHQRSTGENALSELGQLLKELEDARELAAKLQGEEKERILARILAYRKRLLRASVEKIAFDILSKREEKEVEGSCNGDQPQLARALAAPGLFRFQAYRALKAELIDGEKPKGYPEAVAKLEKNLDSMETALKLMDFKTKIDEVYSATRSYLEQVDRLYERLAKRATETALKLAEDNVCDIDKIQSAVEEAFSPENVSAELRRVFRSSKEFFDLRGALAELRTRLGNTESAEAEKALEPYLRRIMKASFKR